MAELHPSLWRTCRVIANEQRLRLLWLLFSTGKSSVGALSRMVGLSQPNTSIQLRSIQARGLISSHKQYSFVYYSPEPNTSVEHAPVLLSVLAECHSEGVTFQQIIKDATGFTHPRRIDIVKTLKSAVSGVAEQELSVSAHIPVPSLARHLKKLVARGYVEKDDLYRLGKPRSSLAKVLLELSCNEPAAT